ncbi:MAG: polysaccharide biosynthesis C-terminal domain-containing protein, partial [Candidatus Woesearchaeota archaeon]
IMTAAVFNLILDVILVPLIGIEGAALATLLSYILILILTSARIKSFLTVKMPWGSWAKNLFAAVMFVAVVWLLKSSISMFGDVTEMMVVGIIGFSVYTLLLLILKVIDLKEIRGVLTYALKNK